MRATLTIAALVAVGGAACLPAQAFAGTDLDWVSCQLYDSVHKKVVHPNSSFSKEAGVDAGAMYVKFLASAKDQGKIDATSKAGGACTISSNVDDANNKTWRFVLLMKSIGAQEESITFVGD